MAEPHVPLSDWLADRDIHDVQVAGTNLEGSFIGKVFAPRRFLSGLDQGFAFSDVAFGLDLGNKPVFGFAMPPWRTDLGDILLKPDLDTVIEWAPGRAAVLGTFTTEAGAPLSVCPRSALADAVAGLGELGYTAKVAVEMEASVFEESIQQARATGFRNLTPLGGPAGSLFHLAKTPDWSGYLTAVTRRLDALGIEWEAWNDEAAAGQVEVNLAPTDPITAADAWARTRQVMREVAFDRGHCVTFMAKCSDEYGQGSHLNVSLERDVNTDKVANAFYAPDGPSAQMLAFLGGLVATMPAASSYALPFITSFRRLHDLDGPPTTCTWGVDNKTAGIRAIVGHPTQSRLEYRTPGADANVYLVLAAILAAGTIGLTDQLQPPPETTVMGWGLTDAVRIPDSITQGIDALAADDLLRRALGDELTDYWIGTKRWEWMQFHTGGGELGIGLTDWELTRYFELP